MTDIAEIASYVALAVLIVIGAFLLWGKLFSIFSTAEIISKVNEQDRLREINESNLSKESEEIKSWRKKGVM